MTTTQAFGRIFSMPYALMLPLVPLALLCTIGYLYPTQHYRVPEQIPYWAFFFGLPHIVSSFQTICDKEYLVAYQKQVGHLAGLCFLPIALYGLGVPASAILTAVLVLTVHHIVAQQYGIALSVAGLRPSTIFAICKWSTMLLGTAAYLKCYAEAAANGSDEVRMLFAFVDFLMVPLAFVIVATGGLLVWQARARRAGAVLLAVNIVLFLFSLALIAQPSYVLVGLMLARILHDITGFVVYIGHDTARNRGVRKNFLYRAVPFLPIWVLNPLFAIAIAAGLTYLANLAAFVGWLVVGITLAHYYSESFIWRGRTPHRQNFRLAGT